jgi:subtilisin family serine protease
MATIITRFLHHLALFLLIVQFADAVLIPKTKNYAALKLQSSSTTYIVHANDLAKPPHFGSLEEWYRSMVTTHASSTRAATSSGILYTYDTVMHGFAVQLTGDEARLMSRAPGVIGVYEDRVLYPQTTRSPGFMGLEPGNGAWKQTDFGDGVIIGIIDGGIWPESASFHDSGLGPVRSSWKGKCVDAHDFNANLCNNKLVGAKAFITAADAVAGRKRIGIPSPRDEEGHGTHVASTAAGAEVRNASLYTFSRGTAWGMAPKARIAMYKACSEVGCLYADIIAAVDAAVKDGVDIISMSLGGNPPDPPFHDDVVAIALFGAERKGVFVVLAGGNDGPQASTVTNSAPWMTTVGASTVDRLFPASLTLGNGVVLAEQSLYTMHAKGTPMIQLLSADCRRRDEWKS